MESNDPRHLYWKKTRLIGAIAASVVLIIMVLAPLLSYLSAFSFFGFPLDFFFLAQGLILMIIGAAFWFSINQEEVDRQHRMGEDI